MKEYRVNFVVSFDVCADDEYDAENQAYKELCEKMGVDNFDYLDAEVSELL